MAKIHAPPLMLWKRWHRNLQILNHLKVIYALNCVSCYTLRHSSKYWTGIGSIPLTFHHFLSPLPVPRHTVDGSEILLITCYLWNPMKNRIFSVSTGAGFLPSAAWDVMQPNCHRLIGLHFKPPQDVYSLHVMSSFSYQPIKDICIHIDLNKIHPTKIIQIFTIYHCLFRKPLPVSMVRVQLDTVSPCWHLARRWRRQRHFGIFGLHTATWNWGRKLYDHQESWR